MLHLPKVVFLFFLLKQTAASVSNECLAAEYSMTEVIPYYGIKSGFIHFMIISWSFQDPKSIYNFYSTCSIPLALVRAIDKGLTLATSAFKLFTMANLSFKLGW